ncbi:MAG: acyl-CoA dehydrogenase [Polyangiaceae bacterium]|nr:acyl-CoA dehydrogenase [Polyangiaceae bacterium]
MANPLISDRHVEFLLFELFDAEGLCGLPHFADHSRETFELYLASAKRLARDVLFPAYRPFDEAPPVLERGRVKVHPLLHDILPQMVELGIIAATRPADVGGQQLPLLVACMANAYLMAANASAYGFIGLTSGAGRLLESFGSEALKREYMEPMYEGRWAGTMALTEPQAGSSLTDVQTHATPTDQGYHLIRGSKIFISGGDQDVTENIVHLLLARIDGAPPGIKGVSLFAVPRLRREGDRLVPNDVAVTGAIHKIGWRGLPSLALDYGENDDCRGWLVGEPHQGIRYMFQMMNEARLMVGVNGVATASAAYHEALAYAADRPQGRRLGEKDPTRPQVPIMEHADVRRMLLRQKAIVEGGLSLLAECARLSDLGEYAEDTAERDRSRLLLDLLTPVAKTFPAERGFEANALSVQVHGGYGYSSEYLPESWLRDQKLNSIHEGTTGIQSMDLLGRKVMGHGGQSLFALRDELVATIADARAAGVDDEWCGRLEGALAALGSVTEHLGGLGMNGDVAGMLLHSVDYMDLFSTVVIGWQWLKQAAAAKRGLDAGRGTPAFYEGKLCAAQYWINTELPRAGYLAALCRSGEDSYARMEPEWF